MTSTGSCDCHCQRRLLARTSSSRHGRRAAGARPRSSVRSVEHEVGERVGRHVTGQHRDDLAPAIVDPQRLGDEVEAVRAQVLAQEAWIVGVHGPDVRRTVSPTRTTAVMLPPDRTTSSMRGPYRRRTPRPRCRESRAMSEPDVLIVGAGLAGLVATHELVKAGRRVLVLEQENRNNLGGQAFWSLGGLFLVDSPEQRRMGIKDSLRARAAGLAGLGRSSTASARTTGRGSGPRRTSTSRRARSAGYLRDLGLRVMPIVGWAERGDGSARRARQLGAALPPHLGHRARGRAGLPRAGARRPSSAGLVDVRVPPPGRRADRRGRRGRSACAGRVLAPTDARARRASRSRERGRRVRAARPGRRSSPPAASAATTTWCARTGRRPARHAAGAHDRRRAGARRRPDARDHRAAGGNIVNRDRMWHYTEGIHNWDPIWPNHGIRILPGPSSLWLDADRPAAAGAVLPRLRHARHAAAHPRAPATTTRGSS